MSRDVSFVELDRVGLNCQHAAVRHRVASVDAEVDHDLLELSGVGMNRGDARARALHELDVLADETAEEG
jgi:hypothetical protein